MIGLEEIRAVRHRFVLRMAGEKFFRRDLETINPRVDGSGTVIQFRHRRRGFFARIVAPSRDQKIGMRKANTHWLRISFFSQLICPPQRCSKQR